MEQVVVAFKVWQLNIAAWWHETCVCDVPHDAGSTGTPFWARVSFLN